MKIALLLSILSQRRIFIVFLLILIAYILLYLSATQQLIFTARMGPADSFFALKILPNWPELIFKSRSPFLFEPIGALYLGHNLKLLLPPPNLLIAGILGTLVAANLATSYYSFRNLGLRGVRGFGALAGTIPAVLSGATCCAPTIVLVIGLQLTSTLATVWSLFVPISFVLLLLALLWSLRKIEAKETLFSLMKEKNN